VQAAAAALKAAGNLADSQMPLRPVALPRSDLWSLAGFGRPVRLGLARQGQPTPALMFGLPDAGPQIPTFHKDELVRLWLELEIPARLRLIHVNPERHAHLVAPSQYLLDERLPAGRSILPTTAPAGLPVAFAIHEPIGLHYLVAVAVSEQAAVALPTVNSDDPKIRPLTDTELDLLGQQLGRLADPDLFGVGMLRYQVAPT
jgi:hypothetical protein